ncbi:MAG: MarR family transcriptional regulator [Deltaproteobacteria bacterium]|nr:MarR family transcriptional regulator [Deltaproteobacteria bacterium]
MTAVLKSPRKFEILRLINERERVTSRELAELTGLELPHVSKMLHRYVSEGLIRREPIGGRGGPFSYELTDPGRRRLFYFFKISK